MIDLNRKIDPQLELEINKITEQVENKQIPEYYPREMINSLDGYRLRSNFIKKMGFALIANEWIKPLSQWISNRKCLEVMSGTGALSFALQQQGIDITATDDFSWKPHEDWEGNNRLWAIIENVDAINAVEKYGESIDIIIMSWPYMDDIALKVLQKMREINPSCIMIYIGEGCGGCTADDDFHNTMNEIEDDEFEQAISDFKHWWGLHDYPQLIK